MIFVRRARYHNWMCFKGTHEIELDPCAYAVYARSAKDPERSNWLGKSALGEGIHFALTGLLNPDRHQGADGWVTDGEAEGGVLLELSDGTVIERARKKATRLHVTPAGGKTAAREEAQQVLDDIVGLTADDSLRTYYFQQRQMARLILAKPEDRMSFVSAWFGLDPLERAEDIVRTDLASHSWQSEAVKQQIELVRALEVRELGGGSVESVRAQIAQLEGELEEAQDKLGRLEQLLETNADLVGAVETTRRYDELETELGAQHEVCAKAGDWDKLDKALAQAKKVAAAAADVYSVARRDAIQKRQLVRGEFDGHCPVAEMPCPVAKKINEERARSEALRTAAEKVETAALQALEDAGRRETHAQAAVGEKERLRDRIERTSTEMGRMRAEYDRAATLPPPADAVDLRSRIQWARVAVSDLASKLTALRRSITLVHEARAEAARFADSLAVEEREIALLREELLIFGKHGAQRRVAEGALAHIQERANARLALCGVDLELEVRWTREGKDLAKTCDRCGHPFPSSAKVKECERCNAERGKNLVNKLDIMLSEQSGAAEDLAGWALQISAAAWLREARGSRWGLAIIDEPVGQLDAAHRRVFTAHLAQMLSGVDGFAQALVVAHHSAVLDSLPGKILVTSDGQFSTVQVVK